MKSYTDLEQSKWMRIIMITQSLNVFQIMRQNILLLILNIGQLLTVKFLIKNERLQQYGS